MVEQQELSTIPSRRQARKLGGRLVRAKSDWYWAIGGDVAVASALKCDELVDESDHERVAALTCLSLAAEIVGGTALALGDEQGVYTISGQIAASWKDDVRRVGLIGAPSFRHVAARVGQEDIELVAVQVASPAMPAYNPPSDEAVDFDKGDEVDLVLCDSGGVNEKHNSWLQCMPSPVHLVMRIAPETPIVLSHGRGRKDNPDQWVMEPKANQLRDRFGHHDFGPKGPMSNPHGALSKENALSLPVRIS